MSRHVIVNASVVPDGCRAGEEFDVHYIQRVINAVGAPGVTLHKAEIQNIIVYNGTAGRYAQVRMEMSTMDASDDDARLSVASALRNANKVGVINAHNVKVTKSSSARHIGYRVVVMSALRLGKVAAADPDLSVATYTKRMFTGDATLEDVLVTVDEVCKGHTKVDAQLTVLVHDTDMDMAVGKVINAARSFPWHGITCTSVRRAACTNVYTEEES
ncbi:MAG: hypothetical protein E6R04_03660 [Spirochaetes bacterium]|nr:MAG: hypothetical protein E6R04_03660 [Spirochaetota bacterium]